MRTVSILSIAVLTAGIVVACGETDDASKVDIDSTVVKAQSSALATALGSAETNGGADMAEQLLEIGTSAAALIPSTKGGSGAHMSGGGTSTCACATAAQKTCSFAGCKIGNATASGTISWGDGKLVCSNLTFEVPAPAGTTSIAMTCQFTFDNSTLDGFVRAIGNNVVSGVAYSWDATLTATDVTWSAKTFTGGTVDVAATVTASSTAEGTDTFHATGSVAFP